MSQTKKPQRSRVGKEHAEYITKQIQEQGYMTHQSPGKIIIWKADLYLASLIWEKNDGWRLDLRHPSIYSEEDLQSLFSMLPLTQAAIQETKTAWEAFKKSKSNKTWQEYFGLVASHFYKFLTQEDK